MVNFAKRVEKFSDNHLMPGEKIVSAVFMQQRGSLSSAALRASLGLIGMLLSHFMAKKAEPKLNNTASHLSRMLPDRTMIIAVTDKRILVYKHKELGASVEAFACEYKLGDIVDVQSKFRMLMSVVTLQFKDGGSVSLEAGLGQDLKDFAKYACNR